MKLTLVLLMLIPCMAQDKAKDQATEMAKLKSDLKLADLKSLVFQEQLTAKNLEQLRAEIEAKRVEVCKDAHVDPDPKLCQINLIDRTVTAAKPETINPPQTQAKKP